MTPQANKPSSHDVITGSLSPSAADRSVGHISGYGVITNIINGGLECGKGQNDKVEDKIGFYRRYCSILPIKACEGRDPKGLYKLAPHTKLLCSFLFCRKIFFSFDLILKCSDLLFPANSVIVMITTFRNARNTLLSEPRYSKTCQILTVYATIVFLKYFHHNNMCKQKLYKRLCMCKENPDTAPTLDIQR
ncbi:chitinase [Artemisia annua]|uniref:Chitinase n=1 Tax=Artemisia annua TaxID=35608 RepID=A0A2U1LDD2_ARTAN|nr:chitinase [Artemisia annua]